MVQTPCGPVPAPSAVGSSSSLNEARLRQFIDLPRRAVGVPLSALGARPGVSSGRGTPALSNITDTFVPPPAASPTSMAASSGAYAAASAAYGRSASLAPPQQSHLYSTLQAPSHSAFALPSSSQLTLASGQLTTGTGTSMGGRDVSMAGVTRAGLHSTSAVASSGNGRFKLDLSQELAALSTGSRASSSGISAYGNTGNSISFGAGTAIGISAASNGLTGLQRYGPALAGSLTRALGLKLPDNSGAVSSSSRAGVQLTSSLSSTGTAHTPGHGLRPSGSHADRTAGRGSANNTSSRMTSGSYADVSTSGGGDVDVSNVTNVSGFMVSGRTPGTAYRSLNDSSVLAVAESRTPAALHPTSPAFGDQTAAALAGQTGTSRALAQSLLSLSPHDVSADGSGSSSVIGTLLASLGPAVPLSQPGAEGHLNAAAPSASAVAGLAAGSVTARRLATAAAARQAAAKDREDKEQGSSGLPVVLGISWPAVKQIVWIALRPQQVTPSSGTGAAAIVQQQQQAKVGEPTLSDAVNAAAQTLFDLLAPAVEAAYVAAESAGNTDVAAGYYALADRARAELYALIDASDVRAVVSGVLYPLDTPLSRTGLGERSILQLMRVGAVRQDLGASVAAIGTVDGSAPARGDVSDNAHDDTAAASSSSSLCPTLGSLESEGYATEPPLAVLRTLSERQLAAVPDFTVYRTDQEASSSSGGEEVAYYGAITWPGDTDVRGLDLERIVRIERGDVIVYRDGSEDDNGAGVNDSIVELGVTERRPPLGQGLNKAAIVTLEGVFPQSLGVDETIDFVSALQSHCHTMGATWRGYDVTTGTWEFDLPHFEPQQPQA